MTQPLIAASHILFIQKDDKLLMQRRFNTGFEDGNYGLPAGHIEKSETALAAAIREAHEEVGVTLQAQELSLVHIMYRLKVSYPDRIYFFFRASAWQGTPSVREPHKADELKWFDFHLLPENTIDYIRLVLGHITQGNFYSELKT